MKTTIKNQDDKFAIAKDIIKNPYVKAALIIGGSLAAIYALGLIFKIVNFTVSEYNGLKHNIKG